MNEFRFFRDVVLILGGVICVGFVYDCMGTRARYECIAKTKSREMCR